MEFNGSQRKIVVLPREETLGNIGQRLKRNFLQHFRNIYKNYEKNLSQGV